MARVYATEADLTAWLPTGATLPADPDAALRAASEVVDEMLLTALYAVDAAGMPTDTGVAAALADATCAQVAYAQAHGDAYGQGSTGRYASASLGPISLTKKTSTAGTDPEDDGDGRRSGRAWRYLQRAGLIPQGPVTWIC